jgi:hypothetical protein
VREQVAVRAAQGDEALGRADREGRHGHALEDEIGMAREQHAVLEGAGLAFVGVAHHHASVARRLAAQTPLGAGGKACAAAAAASVVMRSSAVTASTRSLLISLAM